MTTPPADHDLLIEIKTMLTVALDQLKTQAAQLGALSETVNKQSQRITALESSGRERSRLPNWVPTLAMVSSLAVAVIAVVAALRK